MEVPLSTRTPAQLLLRQPAGLLQHAVPGERQERQGRDELARVDAWHGLPLGLRHAATLTRRPDHTVWPPGPGRAGRQALLAGSMILAHAKAWIALTGCQRWRAAAPGSPSSAWPGGLVTGLDRQRADAAGQQIAPVPGLASTTAAGLARRITPAQWRAVEKRPSAGTGRMPEMLSGPRGGADRRAGHHRPGYHRRGADPARSRAGHRCRRPGRRPGQCRSRPRRPRAAAPPAGPGGYRPHHASAAVRRRVRPWSFKLCSSPERAVADLDDHGKLVDLAQG